MDLIIVGALMNSFFGVVDDDAVVGDLHSLEGSQDQTHYESNGEQDEEDDYDSFPIFFLSISWWRWLPSPPNFSSCFHFS